MNLGKTVNALKNKVLETVQTNTKPKFISEDENFNLLYDKYSRLGHFENQLNNLVRDSVSSIQKSTQANKELSVFLQMTMEGQLRDCFDINSITEKFCNLQNSIASAHFNDFMSNTQQQFLKPVLRDKELDQQLQVHLEGRVIDERLVEMLTLRAEERTITLSQVILSIMETQYNYFTTIATLYADLHGELQPMMAKMAGRKAGNAKPNSPPQQPAKPPTQSNTPPATQSAPQNGAINRARGNSATPPPSHPRPVPQEPPKPEPPTVTTNIFVDDDFLTAPAATKANSREALFSFDDGPNQSAPLNPTANDFFNNNKKSSYFDDFDTLAPQKMNTAQKPANNGNHANNANSFDPFGGFSGGSNNYFGGNAAPTTNAPKSSSGLDDLNWGPSSQQQQQPPKSASPVPSSSALQEKIDRDRQQQQEQDARRHLDVLVSEKVEAWAANKKGNLRALLANLHQIIYEDSGWSEAPLSELVQAGALKKVYRKAMLVVHPDKTAGKSLETRLLAERLFSTLQEAAKTAQWN